MSSEIQVWKQCEPAISFKAHRGDSTTLVAMIWRKGKPALDFVGLRGCHSNDRVRARA